MEEKFIKLSSLFEYLDSREDYWREKAKTHMEKVKNSECNTLYKLYVEKDIMALEEVKEFIETLNHFPQYTKAQLLENKE